MVLAGVQESPPHRSIQLTERVDVDGDGYEERIILTCYTLPDSRSLDQFVLEVSATSVVVSSENVNGTFHIVDVDTTDTLLEIAVPASGPSSDESVYFFRYFEGQLWQLGWVPGAFSSEVKIGGAGVVTTRCRGEILHSWRFSCQYRIDPVDGRLKFVHNPPYNMNTDVVLKRDLMVYDSQASSEPSGIIRSGQHATILLSDNERWCFIESENGTKGWFRISGYSRVGGYDAREVFDGLEFVD